MSTRLLGKTRQCGKGRKMREIALIFSFCRYYAVCVEFSSFFFYFRKLRWPESRSTCSTRKQSSTRKKWKRRGRRRKIAGKRYFQDLSRKNKRINFYRLFSDRRINRRLDRNRQVRPTRQAGVHACQFLLCYFYNFYF